MKTMLTEEYRERLNRWFDQNYYEILHPGACNSIEIKERDHSWTLACHIGNVKSAPSENPGG